MGALDPDRARAANLIASGHTYAETADQLGVHKATITRWAQTSAFKEAVERAKSSPSIRSDHDTARERLLLALKSKDDKVAIAAAHELRGWLGGPADAEPELSEEWEPDD